ncbi:MAG TPA: SBBP repeat-containing protein, partial [Candidatus Acidoferrales bacterium]
MPAVPTKLKAQPHARQKYGDIPLSFEANQGQTDPSVRFVSHGSDYTLFLTANEAVLSLQQQNSADDPALRKMKPAKRKLFESGKFYRGSSRSRKSTKSITIGVAMKGANPASTIEALDQLPGTTNYFIGDDPQKWHTGIPTFQRVKYSAVYPGIDLIYYGKQKQLEFDFIVAPGGDPHAISLDLRTAGRVSIAKSGNLLIKADGGSFELRRPELYQLDHGAKRHVSGRFVRRGYTLVGLQIGPYDHRRDLVVDPALAYSTYLGGNGIDDGFGVAVDAGGNSYVVGQTTSTNFPLGNEYSSASNSTGI